MLVWLHGETYNYALLVHVKLKLVILLNADQILKLAKMSQNTEGKWVMKNRLDNLEQKLAHVHGFLLKLFGNNKFYCKLWFEMQCAMTVYYRKVVYHRLFLC